MVKPVTCKEPVTADQGSRARKDLLWRGGVEMDARIRVPTFFYVVYSSRGTPPPKKGKRALLGDLEEGTCCAPNFGGDTAKTRRAIWVTGLQQLPPLDFLNDHPNPNISIGPKVKAFQHSWKHRWKHKAKGNHS